MAFGIPCAANTASASTKHCASTREQMLPICCQELILRAYSGHICMTCAWRSPPIWPSLSGHCTTWRTMSSHPRWVTPNWREAQFFTARANATVRVACPRYCTGIRQPIDCKKGGTGHCCSQCMMKSAPKLHNRMCISSMKVPSIPVVPGVREICKTSQWRQLCARIMACAFSFSSLNSTARNARARE